MLIIMNLGILFDCMCTCFQMLLRLLYANVILFHISYRLYVSFELNRHLM